MPPGPDRPTTPTSPSPVVGPLTGFTIGVTAHRRAVEQIELLERKGATTLHGPTIHTHPLIAEPAIAAAIRSVIDDPPAYTLLSTGIGVRAWFDAAESIDLADPLLDVLRRSTVLARGPKAAGAAATVGLHVDWQTPSGFSTELIDELRQRNPAGQRVAVQLDGRAEASLAHEAATTGAEIVPIPVYEWTMPADTTAAGRLVTAVCERRVDAVTFTAQPQISNLVTVAEGLGLGRELVDAFSASVVAICVGPVCAAGLDSIGATDPIVPARYRLGSMVQAAAASFRSRALRLHMAGVTVTLQGRAVVFPDGACVWLTDKERAVLDVLSERPGVVMSKDHLLRRVWNDTESDPHVVEVTVGRLRQRLGSAGAGVETVIRRGYRLTEV